MIKDYIKESYPSVPITEGQYLSALNLEGYSLYKTRYGFFNYKIQGDAMIIGDVFVAPEHRSKGKCRELFQKVRQIAKLAKVNVLIGFSETENSAPGMGQGMMKALGFEQSYETSAGLKVFIRGAY